MRAAAVGLPAVDQQAVAGMRTGMRRSGRRDCSAQSTSVPKTAVISGSASHWRAPVSSASAAKRMESGRSRRPSKVRMPLPP